MAARPPRIGILTAMPSEAATLTSRAVPDRIIPLAPRVDLVLCGIGARRAARAARMLLDAGSELLVSWGSAAGLCRSLEPGGLVLPRVVIAATGETHRADAAAHARSLRALADLERVVTGPIAEAGGLLGGEQSKAALAERTGAVAADMESAAIAMAAQSAGRGWIAVRVVLDPVSMTVPSCVSAGVDARGSVRLRPLAIDLMRHPGQLGDLLALVKGYRRARATMRAAAARFVSSEGVAGEGGANAR